MLSPGTLEESYFIYLKIRGYCLYLLLFFTQVHGIANDTIAFVKKIINTEINSATDNPVSLLG